MYFFENYVYDGNTMWKEEIRGKKTIHSKVANFWPLVEKAVKQGDNILMELCIVYSTGKQRLVVWLKDLKRVEDLLPPVCVIYPDVRNFSAVMNFIIRGQISIALEKKCVYLRQGWNLIGENVVFLEGNEVIGERELYLYEPSKNKFMGSDSLEPKQIATQFMRRFDLYPGMTEILSLNFLWGVMQPLVELSGVHHNFSVFLCGPTGCMKTTLAKLFSILDGDDSTFKSGNSTAASNLDCFRQNSSCVFVWDDLCKSQSKAVMRRQQRDVSEFLQQVGDCGEYKKMYGRKVVAYKVRGAVICTGEYMIENPSTLNRCILIEMEFGHMDLDYLTQLQDFESQYHLNVLVRMAFIHYLCTKENLPEQLRDRIHYFEKESDLWSMRGNILGRARMIKTCACLKTVLAIWCEYLSELGLVMEEIRDLSENCLKALEEIMKCQCEKLSVHDKQEDGNILRIIDTIISYDGPVVQSKKAFLNSRDAIGFTDEEFAYVIPDLLVDELKRYEVIISKKRLIDMLAINGMIRCDNEKRTVQLSKCRRRMIKIRYLELNQALQNSF